MIEANKLRTQVLSDLSLSFLYYGYWDNGVGNYVKQVKILDKTSIRFKIPNTTTKAKQKCTRNQRHNKRASCK